jgi:nitrogen fixation NifU-like protein
MNIYKELLIEHYRHPRNKGRLSDCDFSTQLLNPSCGDSVSFQGKINGEAIFPLRFDGAGCVISQAVASLLAQMYENKKISDVLGISAAHLQEMIGMQLGPMRLKCALLPLEALQKGLLEARRANQDAGSCKSNEDSSRASR